MQLDRRVFLSSTAALAVVGRAAASPGGKPTEPKPQEDEEEVTPAEDLMREHGVLRRVLQIYDEAQLMLHDRTHTVPLAELAQSARLIRRVIEDYHEKLEENFLFPRFEKAGKLTDLTAVLRKQHQAGRDVTDHVLAMLAGKLHDADRAKLAEALARFNRMYRAHAAREDTVLFPEIRKLVGKKAYAELGEQFEAKEREMLGKDGFEGAVAEVAKLEVPFGLDDLAKLTA